MAFTKHTFSFIIEKRKAILPKSDSEEKIPPPHIGENQGDKRNCFSKEKEIFLEVCAEGGGIGAQAEEKLG
jgi:hypothetical protein